MKHQKLSQEIDQFFASAGFDVEKLRLLVVSYSEMDYQSGTSVEKLEKELNDFLDNA